MIIVSVDIIRLTDRPDPKHAVRKTSVLMPRLCCYLSILYSLPSDDVSWMCHTAIQGNWLVSLSNARPRIYIYTR